MHNLPDNWQPRHVAALEAWEQGDLDRLCELCDREIRIEASKLSSSPAADFAELCQQGREAVWGCAERYQPSTGVPFQAFARQRIHYAMISLLGQQQQILQEPDEPSADFTAVLEAALKMVRDGERDESAFTEALDMALSQISLKEWPTAVDDMSIEAATFLRTYLWQNKGEFSGKMGKKRYWKILGPLNTKYWIHVLEGASRQDKEFVTVSGPQQMVILQRKHKVRNPLAPPISKRQLAKVLGVSDKTIAEWEKRIEKAGAPPPMLNPDGTYRLNTQEEHDQWADYWLRIADPRGWRRLQRNRQTG
jgi:RNA polymerase sigma factor (sigma-70 family)